MSSLALIAEYFGRKFHPGRILIYVIAISILASPTIIMNIAWQLSFASYAGIMFLSPLLNEYFYGKKSPSFIAEMIIIAISAQLFCAPISIYYYGQISIIGIVANILVTPVIPAVMALTALIGIFPRLITIPFLFLDKSFLSFQIFTINYLSEIK